MSDETAETTSLNWKDEQGGCWYRWHGVAFASGNERDCFIGFATNICENPALPPGSKIVVKRFRQSVRWSRDDWAKDIKAMEVVADFADRWNAKDLTKRKLKVHKSEILPVTDSKSSQFPTDSFIMLEPFLEGDYQKWNSNSGYVHWPQLAIHAFSHWTFEESGGKQLVCDLQGVLTDDEYIITDPCVMSLDAGTFGMTDCGKYYMEEWMRDHKCNDFCNKEWRIVSGTSTRPQKKATSLSWDVMSAMGKMSSMSLSIPESTGAAAQTQTKHSNMDAIREEDEDE